MSGVDGNPENTLAMENYALLAGKALTEMADPSSKLLHKSRTREQEQDVDEQSPAKIHRGAPPLSFDEVFREVVNGMDQITLSTLSNVHKHTVEALMIVDPKRNTSHRVPSRFCSFHLADFDLDEKSTLPLGPPYQPDQSLPRTRITQYVTAGRSFNLSSMATNVISLRVVKVGPDCAYPVEVYGKVIARDELDYKCVFLFDRERKDAQLIETEKDMLALTGPGRPLNTLDLVYFEFDLKIKGKRDHEDLQFSQGVIEYYSNPCRERIILQLPSFRSTVKLVLQHVSIPVAASINVNVVNEGHEDTFVHYNGKITAGTSRNYRQHMVLYDSSVQSSGSLVTRNGSLVLYRNLVAVNGSAEDSDEELVLYVYFLGAGCEIEDEDKMDPEEEDEEEDDEEEEEPKEEDDEEEEEEEEEEPKNLVTLKYPLCETVWEHGSPKLKVKVDWTAVLYLQKRADYFYRKRLVPDGYGSPNYRYGGFY